MHDNSSDGHKSRESAFWRSQQFHQLDFSRVHGIWIPSSRQSILLQETIMRSLYHRCCAVRKWSQLIYYFVLQHGRIQFSQRLSCCCSADSYYFGALRTCLSLMKDGQDGIHNPDRNQRNGFKWKRYHSMLDATEGIQWIKIVSTTSTFNALSCLTKAHQYLFTATFNSKESNFPQPSRFAFVRLVIKINVGLDTTQ